MKCSCKVGDELNKLLAATDDEHAIEEIEYTILDHHSRCQSSIGVQGISFNTALNIVEPRSNPHEVSYDTMAEIYERCPNITYADIPNHFFGEVATYDMNDKIKEQVGERQRDLSIVLTAYHAKMESQLEAYLKTAKEFARFTEGIEEQVKPEENDA